LNEHLIDSLDELIDKLRRLGVEQILMIDEALGSVGDFGEVRLVVEKGRLRFLVVQKSLDALKWIPGQLHK
jgi:hypothetical protein